MRDWTEKTSQAEMDSKARLAGGNSFTGDQYFSGGRMGFGTSTPASCAAIQIDATNGFVVIPRMTTEQRNAVPSPIAGAMYMDISSGVGTLCQFDGVQWDFHFNPGVLTLSSNFTTSSSTRSTVTAWNFNVLANAVYYIRVMGTYQTSLTANGASFGIGGTAGGSVMGQIRGSVSSSAAATELAAPITSLNSSLTTTGVSAINTPHAFRMEYTFSTTSAGTHAITFGSKNNLISAQLNAGSTLILQRLS